MPGVARPCCGRGCLVGDVPGRPRGLPAPAVREQRSGLAHHDRSPQSDRPSPIVCTDGHDGHGPRVAAHRRRPPDAELWDALRALPFKQRGAVAYHYIAGLPYADVAALLDSSEAAARRSAADGLANLRKTYQRSPA
ncbi:MAG TPA: sigma-70 region 4 domain-containing protein [Acidimicrobiales bacterium]|nr:sigma-70 region 4 domain-containing protein [Acidimicrobiales bacterium]